MAPRPGVYSLAADSLCNSRYKLELETPNQLGILLYMSHPHSPYPPGKITCP